MWSTVSTPGKMINTYRENMQIYCIKLQPVRFTKTEFFGTIERMGDLRRLWVICDGRKDKGIRD